MKQEQTVWVRLPLERAYNVRELGGLPTMDGRQTLWRAFLRSDDISKLTDADITTLLDYGVNTVIDLRSKSEVTNQPDRLGEENDVTNINLSFMQETDLSPQGIENMSKIEMGDMYIEMLKRHEIVGAIFTAIAQAQPGCILFHCAAGKDRTGVLAMLLLMLAGVDKRDCINNYAQTYQNLLRDERFLSALGENITLPMLESRPEYLEKAYTYIESNGGITTYLKSCGLSEELLDIINERLTGLPSNKNTAKQ